MLSTELRHVAVGKVSELEEVSNDGPTAGAGREIFGGCEQFSA